MITIPFLADWGLRSSILILTGALLLRALRLKNPSLRLAAWTTILVGSLAIPVLSAALPKMLLAMSWPTIPLAPAPRIDAPVVANEAAQKPITVHPQVSDAARQEAGASTQDARASQPFDWAGATVIIYALGVGAMLLRLFRGLTLSLRLLQASNATGRATDGIEIRESDRVDAPVTLGVVRPAIVLPADWREWNEIKLEAVLAHERSHVQRRDPMVQVLSMIHRAILWYSPLSWFLHQRIVRSAEEASDDAAVEALRDPASYAAVLLDFMQRAVSEARLVGVRMARYGSPAQRIHRILDGSSISSGLTRWSVAAILVLGSPLVYVVATAQVRPEFEVADVHVSPVLPGERQRALLGRLPPGAVLPDGRYEAQHASLVDLIATAYSVAPDMVVGGPSWLEWNHFDVRAKASANTRPDAIPLMLQSLLADRFGLAVHNDTKSLPVYVLALGAGKHKLKAATNSEPAGCRVAQDNDGLSCRGTTVAELASRLAAAPSTKLRVLNSTGIEGSWDFDISYPRPNAPPRGLFGIPPPGDSDRGVFEAIEKQLGLKLEFGSVPQPVLVVDRANQPISNPPNVPSRSTALLDRFEVATIKPCKGIDPSENPAFSGFLVSTVCMPLSGHINFAWGYMNGPGSPEDAVERPGWTDSKYFDIAARSPIAIAGPRDPNYLAMLRNLLVERFQIKFHYEDRPRDVRVLVADKPKLKPAVDPSSRARCYRPRGFSSLSCQNVTMAQFVEQIGTAGGSGRFYESVEETGLSGSWDLTLSWTNARSLTASNTTQGPPDPLGVTSLEEALQTQLGLKLVARKRPAPILIIDHIEEQPTEN